MRALCVLHSKERSNTSAEEVSKTIISPKEKIANKQEIINHFMVGACEDQRIRN